MCYILWSAKVPDFELSVAAEAQDAFVSVPAVAATIVVDAVVSTVVVVVDGITVTGGGGASNEASLRVRFHDDVALNNKVPFCSDYM